MRTGNSWRPNRNMSDHASDFVLQAISFDTLEGWKDDDPSGLFEVMRRCRR
ncbi:MAG TPA: transglycosylase, partial [Rhizobium sp.]|nr:transglycosylase [Rhizobium sp.]